MGLGGARAPRRQVVGGHLDLEQEPGGVQPQVNQLVGTTRDRYVPQRRGSKVQRRGLDTHVLERESLAAPAPRKDARDGNGPGARLPCRREVEEENGVVEHDDARRSRKLARPLGATPQEPYTEPAVHELPEDTQRLAPLRNPVLEARRQRVGAELQNGVEHDDRPGAVLAPRAPPPPPPAPPPP